MSITSRQQPVKKLLARVLASLILTTFPQMENLTDLSSVPEELLCTESIIKYIVKDKTTETQIPDRAQKSMPTNLVLKPTCALPDSSIIGVWAKEYIPAGTR